MTRENEMKSPRTYIDELSKLLPEIPADSIVSRTLFTDEKVKVVLFGFAPGQELSEHTASHPAVLHFLQGEAKLTLGEESHEAKAGTWVHMAPNLSHSVHAITDVKMLLTLLRN
jgi:quercetin dioxygenase-like cupin family protein